MSTSGTVSWSLKRDGIISSSLRKLGVLPSGGTASAQQIADGAEALNAMIKGFQADGMPVWEMDKYTFTVIKDQAQYLIGNGQALNTNSPLKIVQAYRNQLNSVNVPMNIYTQYNYNLLPLAISSGTPINLYYQPREIFGEINLWPKPADSTTTITIVYQNQFEDMTSSMDDIDFPSWWTEAVIYGLAWRLSGEYGIPLMDRNSLSKEAEFFHQSALLFGVEEGSLYLQPDWSGKR